MKKILVTGAAGKIGFQVIKSLLTESKYQITALDLKFKNSIKSFKKYGKRIDFVFGDINDNNLMEDLVKDKDVIIHLAAVMPPLANIKPELADLINYDGSKVLVDAINENNPNCFLIFASSSCVYGNRNKNPLINIKDPIVELEKDHYAKTKINTEVMIKKELKNYAIFRIAPTLSTIKDDNNIFNLPLKSKLEMITVNDAAYAFTRAVDHNKELKGKTFNVSGGEKCRTTYKEFLINLLKIYGLTFRLFKSLILGEKNYFCGYFKDSDELEKIINYQSDSLKTYYNKIKNETNKLKRFIPKILGYPIILILKRKG